MIRVYGANMRVYLGYPPRRDLLQQSVKDFGKGRFCWGERGAVYMWPLGSTLDLHCCYAGMIRVHVYVGVYINKTVGICGRGVVAEARSFLISSDHNHHHAKIPSLYNQSLKGHVQIGGPLSSQWAWVGEKPG